MAEICWPWKMAAIGMGLVLGTALVGGFVLGYWAGGKPGPSVSPEASIPPASSAPAASPRPQAASAPAAAPPPKVVAAPAAPPRPVAPAPAPVKRPSVEPAPAPAVKPRTAPTGPTAADIDACSRYAFARTEEHDKNAEDDQDRKDDGAYREAYASCLQSRGFKKPRGDD